MVNTMEKERMITIGQMLVDFANAESTNSACNTYFNNIKNLFNFSSKFDEHIKAVFPSLDSCFEPLNKTEKSLVELIFRESTLKNHLNRQFIPIDYELETYDPFNRSLNLVSLKWDRNSSEAASVGTGLLDENRQSSGFLETLKRMGVSAVDGPISIKIDALIDEINDLMGSTAVSKIRELMDLGQKIDILTTDFTEQRLKELYEFCELVKNILKSHSKIEKLQADIKTILETVAMDKSLAKSTIFLNFIDRYNSLPKGELLIGENDVLVQMPPINENNYFQIDTIDTWFEILFNDLTYFLVEFLKLKKDKKYIRKCQACQKYFVVLRLNIQKFCKNKCRENWYKHRSDQARNSLEITGDPEPTISRAFSQAVKASTIDPYIQGEHEI